MKKKVVSAVATVAIMSSTYAGIASANVYKVQKGDTLSHIASKHKTTVNEIKLLNALTSDLIFINQTLKLSTAPEIQPPTIVAPPAPVIASEYTVMSGDYLGKIAKQFGTTVQELKSLNGLTSDMIYVNQKLKVSAQQPVVVTPPPTPLPATSTEYTVIKGDYLGKIAGQNGMTVQQLKALNNLTSDMIYVGQKLKLAGSTPPAPAAPTAPAPPAASTDADLIKTAKSLIGVPYVWGGSTVNGFDCSGFVYYALNQSGQKIGRYSAEGYYSRAYYVDTPQPGDLVFFENTYKRGISHLGIYIGNNEFIHADADGVTITNLNNSYYAKHFDGFKRFY